MHLKVRLFALTREITGTNSLQMTMPEGSTIGDFTNWLYSQYPPLEKYKLRFALNKVYASPDTILNDNDEIACIPPVGGG